MDGKTLLLTVMCIATNALANAQYVMGGSIGRYDTQLGIFELNNKPELKMILSYKTNSITNFTDFLTTVLDKLRDQQNISISRACFGVPGNTTQDVMFIQSPHLSFAVDGHDLLEKKVLKQVFVMNDFEAQAFGVETLNEKNTLQINKGVVHKNAPKLLVGAGAGLGSALITYSQEKTNVLPLGACYMDFAPQNLQELEYIAFLKKRIDEHVITWGKVLGSTGGVVAAYDFMGTQKEYTASLEERSTNAIFAHAPTDEQCKDTVEFYLKLYAQLIRNMAYAVLPHGGVYITNAIALHNSSFFTTPEFFEQLFDCQHPFMKAMFLDIPVYIITESNMLLYGTVQYLLTH